MRIAITHDFFETFGGAERVTSEIAAAFPDAEVHAILGREAVAARMGIGGRVRTLLPPKPWLLKNYRWLAPGYLPLVLGSRLPSADLVISSSYAYAHAFSTRNQAPKLCYCHGPFRHLWSQQAVYAAGLPGGGAARAAFGAYARAARAGDRAAAGRVDRFLTQSPFTAELIRRCYGREAEILAPPIDCERFRPGAGRGRGGYFLFVGRLVEAYKRPSLVLEAFARMPERKLLVAGDGPALGALRVRAGANVEFLGQLDDAGLAEAMQGCAAAIFPSIDDYGLVPLEVNACGRPVLAVRAGGARHTVQPGVTGEFLREQSAQAIVDAVRDFDSERYDPLAIRRHALGWDSAVFRRRIRAAAMEVIEGARDGRRRGPQPGISPSPLNSSRASSSETSGGGRISSDGASSLSGIGRPFSRT
ncbi:MAG TPA: glycosyltransferase [Solirubrobacteraceae bacterium]|nr:glycosyltransferase [Solirubrobacteraceae bacterium]